MNWAVGITVAELMALEEMRYCRVFAGHRGMHRLIANVNVMEVPDVLAWVNPGELLLTTAYSIINDMEAQRRLVPDLAERGLAGLAIKTKRFLDEIPAEMARLADEHDLPLIELSPDTSHPRLLRAILGRILNQQAAILDRTVQVHERLIGVMASGGSLAQLAATLAALIENPVAIWNSSGHLLAADTALARSTNEAEHIAATPPKPGGDPRRRYWSEQMAGMGAEPIQRVVVPVSPADQLQGYIVGWGCGRPLGEEDIRVLELSIGAVAIQLLLQQALASVERRYQNEFLYEWLSGRVTRDEDIVQRGRTLGWDLVGSWQVMLLRATGPGGALTEPAALQPVLAWLTRTVRAELPCAIVGERGHRLIAVLPGNLRTVQGADARSLMMALRRQFRAQFPRLRLEAGIGRTYGQPSLLPDSFAQAQKALDLCPSLAPQEGVLYYQDLGVYRLLSIIRQNEEASTFLRETLGPLLDYDRENKSDLVRSLECYFDHGGSIRQVATALFTHYNTVLYRMRRIREVLGADIMEPQTRLNLQVALKLLRLHGD